MGMIARRGGRWWWYASTTDLAYRHLWATVLNRWVSLPMQTSHICVLSHNNLGESWRNQLSSRARRKRASHFGLAGERAGGL